MYCSHCGSELKANSKFCSNCGKSTESRPDEAKLESPVHSKTLAEYYAPSTFKMIILSVLSFGIYQIYWMAKQWGLVNKFTESKSKDTWGKAIFGVFFCYSLFKQIKQIAQKADIKVLYSPGWLAAAFILLTFLWRAENEIAYLGFLSIVCLIPVNNAMRRYLTKEYGKQNWSLLSKGEFLSILTGLLLVIFWVFLYS